MQHALREVLSLTGVQAAQISKLVSEGRDVFVASLEQVNAEHC